MTYYINIGKEKEVATFTDIRSLWEACKNLLAQVENFVALEYAWSRDRTDIVIFGHYNGLCEQISQDGFLDVFTLEEVKKVHNII